MVKKNKKNKIKKKNNNSGIFADIKLYEGPGFKLLIKLRGHYRSIDELLECIYSKFR